jgi:hypothetical protein
VYSLEFIAGTVLGEGLDIKALRMEAAELRAIIARSHATARRKSGKLAERSLPRRRSRERE